MIKAAARLKNGAQAGFTLLEMLIVLVLLGMLAAALGGLIYFGIAARSRITAVSLDQQDFTSFHRVILLELGRAYPDWIASGSFHSTDFDGRSDQVRFLAPALDVQGQGLAYFWFHFVWVGGRSALVLQTTMSAANSSPILETRFALGLASVKLEYFGISPDGSAESWQASWTKRTVLPGLVAIQVVFPKGDRRSWPIVVVHPDIDADVTCEIDAMTHRCAGR